MKKLMVLKTLIASVVLALSFSLISCNDDKYEPIPVTLEEVNGNYRAKLFTTQGNNISEKIVEFTAKDSVITFEDLPIREIVKTVISDPAKADSAIAEIGKVEYKLDYTPKLNTAENWVELIFAPETLNLQIPVDGTIKNAAITMEAEKNGLFVGYDRTLKFGFAAKKIIVDGVELTPYQIIKYDFPVSIKN